MKTKQYNSAGLSVAFKVPETVEEFDRLAGSEGAALSEATDNVVYRGTLADFRSELCERLATETGVERSTRDTGKVRKNEAGVDEPVLVYDETEVDFIKRVCATKGVEVTVFQPLADEIASKLVFDPKPRERKAATPKRFSQLILNTAKAILGAGKAHSAAEFIKATSGFIMAPLTGVEETDLLVVAAAVKANEDFLAKQRASQYTNV
jgi:hypothetical protein